jgi:hypothetical protein
MVAVVRCSEPYQLDRTYPHQETHYSETDLIDHFQEHYRELNLVVVSQDGRHDNTPIKQTHHVGRRLKLYQPRGLLKSELEAVALWIYQAF